MVGILLVHSCCANGIILKFSLDGQTPAPDEMHVVPGDFFTLYVVSYSPGESYFKHMDAPMLLTTIEDTWIYPEAGDLASITESSPWNFDVTAADSLGQVLAGKHFGFDVSIRMDVDVGEVRHFYLWSGPGPDDSIRVKVVPEPSSAVILAIGALLLRKRR